MWHLVDGKCEVEMGKQGEMTFLLTEGPENPVADIIYDNKLQRTS